MTEMQGSPEIASAASDLVGQSNATATTSS